VPLPELTFVVRWPDGATTNCYSPSLVVEEYFTPGTAYAVADFVSRARTALGIASARVEAKFGFPCSRAATELARIEARAGEFAHDPAARVRVEAFER
jgi:uncharacterized repeat protein (TIGR04042 family)